MEQDRHEAKPKAQEQLGVPEVKTADFGAMKKPALIEFELKNRARILSAPLNIRDAFDRRWLSQTGKAYFQPITENIRPDGELPGRIDPASNKYIGYWEVMFQPKGHPNDFTDVTLSVNGNCLQMKRGEPVILPGTFLENADHAVYPTYRQMPGETRKVTSYVKHFPYTVLRTASKEEYDAQKASGDKATKEARAAEERMA